MGKLFIVVGHSGSGKTYIMRHVMGTSRECVSVTTRPMREGEIDGIDYYFLNKEQFEELYQDNQLAEKTNYNGIGYQYGVTKEELEEKLDGQNAYIIADVHGMTQLKELYPDAITIFLYTDKEHAQLNMQERGDNEGYIAKRLSTYDEEVSNKMKYNFDYVVKNVHNQALMTKIIVCSITVANH
jgi:guanylate kinase